MYSISIFLLIGHKETRQCALVCTACRRRRNVKVNHGPMYFFIVVVIQFTFVRLNDPEGGGSIMNSRCCTQPGKWSKDVVGLQVAGQFVAANDDVWE